MQASSSMPAAPVGAGERNTQTTPSSSADSKHAQPRIWFRFVPEDGWLTVLLVIIVIYLTISSIQIVTPPWTPVGLYILTPIMFFGIVLGYIATQQRAIPDALTHLIVTVVGLLFALYETANAVDGGNMALLLQHTNIWLRTATNPNQNSSDNWVFLLFLAALSFLLTYVSYWLVIRTRRPWLMALANGVVLLINLNWTTGDQFFMLVLYLLAVMLLMVRFTLAENTRHWRRIGLRFSPDLGWDFMQAGVFFAVVVTLLPNLLPLGPSSGSIQRFLSSPNNPWQQAQSRLQQIFGGAGGRGVGSNAFFSGSLQLVGTVNLPNVQILHYRLLNAQDDPTQYLITTAYDTYNGLNTWTQSSTERQLYGAGQFQPGSIPSAVYHLDTYAITMDQTPSNGDSYIFVPGSEAAIFNIPSVTYLSVQAKSPLTWSSVQPLHSGANYEGTGYVSDATTQQLEQVPYPAEVVNTPQNGIYPGTILGEYLPNQYNNISEYVYQTAEQVTKGTTNMYEAAVALENYLRTFTYSTHNPNPPSNQDAVVWFLQHKRGFCTFFASAMAMMGRALGMPTRVVSGYTNGVYDPHTNTYIVRGTQAHTWTQIYFGKYGWINFEPTASFSRFTRPQNITHVTTPTPNSGRPSGHGTTPPSHGNHPAGVGPSNTTTPTSQVGNAAVGVGLSFGAILLLLALAAAVALLWWRALYRDLSPVGAAFARLALLGAWAGAPPRRSQTPAEYAERLSALAPGQQSVFRRLSALYARERWGGGSSPAADSEAIQLYDQARPTLISRIIARLRAMPADTLAALQRRQRGYPRSRRAAP